MQDARMGHRAKKRYSSSLRREQLLIRSSIDLHYKALKRKDNYYNEFDENRTSEYRGAIALIIEALEARPGDVSSKACKRGDFVQWKAASEVFNSPPTS